MPIPFMALDYPEAVKIIFVDPRVVPDMCIVSFLFVNDRVESMSDTREPRIIERTMTRDFPDAKVVVWLGSYHED